MYGLGLLSSKIMVSVLNYIGCEVVHLHPNAILALSYFSMLCVCCLGIPPNPRLFWYFYSLAHYECKDFSDIGLTLCRSCQEEYLKVTFKGLLERLL
jgi:hypothetical protein